MFNDSNESNQSYKTTIVDLASLPIVHREGAVRYAIKYWTAVSNKVKKVLWTWHQKSNDRRRTTDTKIPMKEAE